MSAHILVRAQHAGWVYSQVLSAEYVRKLVFDDLSIVWFEEDTLGFIGKNAQRVPWEETQQYEREIKNDRRAHQNRGIYCD